MSLMALVALLVGAAAIPDARGSTEHHIDANGTSLHVIDHGGEGPPLVFLAGLGNSGHVFDEFAPRFIDRAHVYAFTRRGYGQSGRPEGGYDTGTLAEDVVTLLDSLRIQKAVLAGHSVAGDELTEVAARHPERVAGLVYLDAAYDRSHTTRRLLTMAVLGQLPPTPPAPRGRDRRSVESARDYLERIYGVRWPSGEVEATRVFDEEGRWRGDVTSGSTNARIVRGESAPRYDAIRCPVLAIYSVDRPESRDFPWIHRMVVGRGEAQLKAMRYRSAQRRWEESERRRFASEVPAARIVELRGASHYVFLSDAERVVRELQVFLGGLSQGWAEARADPGAPRPE